MAPSAMPLIPKQPSDPPPGYVMAPSAMPLIPTQPPDPPPGYVMARPPVLLPTAKRRPRSPPPASPPPRETVILSSDDEAVEAPQVIPAKKIPKKMHETWMRNLHLGSKSAEAAKRQKELQEQIFNIFHRPQLANTASSSAPPKALQAPSEAPYQGEPEPPEQHNPQDDEFLD